MCVRVYVFVWATARKCHVANARACLPKIIILLANTQLTLFLASIQSHTCERVIVTTATVAAADNMGLFSSSFPLYANTHTGSTFLSLFRSLPAPLLSEHIQYKFGSAVTALCIVDFVTLFRLFSMYMWISHFASLHFFYYIFCLLL